jgi:hypothetical protein
MIHFRRNSRAMASAVKWIIVERPWGQVRGALSALTGAQSAALGPVRRQLKRPSVRA